MVLNATFNNISVISWLSVLLVKETIVPGENHCLVIQFLTLGLVCWAILLLISFWKDQIVKFLRYVDLILVGKVGMHWNIVLMSAVGQLPDWSHISAIHIFICIKMLYQVYPAMSGIQTHNFSRERH
jgi:hypothetical protein